MFIRYQLCHNLYKGVPCILQVDYMKAYLFSHNDVYVLNIGVQPSFAEHRGHLAETCKGLVESTQPVMVLVDAQVKADSDPLFNPHFRSSLDSPCSFFMVVAASLDAMYTSSFDGNADWFPKSSIEIYSSAFMKPWTWSEIYAAGYAQFGFQGCNHFDHVIFSRHEAHGLSYEILQARFGQFGPNLAKVFHDTPDAVEIEIPVNLCGPRDSKAGSSVFLGGFSSITTIPRVKGVWKHSPMHEVFVMVESPPTEQLPPGSSRTPQELWRIGAWECSIILASTSIASHVYDQCMQHPQALWDICRIGMNSSSLNCGKQLFEIFAHMHLTNTGPLNLHTLRKLTAPVGDWLLGDQSQNEVFRKLQIPRSKLQFIHFTETRMIQKNQYYVFHTSDEASINSLYISNAGEVYIFKVTLSTVAPIQIYGLDGLAGVLNKYQRPWNFVFVLPDRMRQRLEKQPTEPQGTQWETLLHQSALAFDLPSKEDVVTAQGQSGEV